MKVLFIPTYHQSLKTLVPIIKILRDKYSISCKIIIKNDFKNSEYLCKSEKIHYIKINETADKIDKNSDSTFENYEYIDAYIKKLKSFARDIRLIKPIYKFLFRLKSNLISQRKIYNSEYKLIRKERPSLIVVLNDQNELMMMNIAKRLGIETVTLGWSVIASPFYYAKNALLNKKFFLKQWQLKLLKLVIPNSIYKLDKNYIFLIHPIQSLAYRMNGISYTLPGERGKLTDTIIATSEFQKKIILSYGVNSSKIILNGDNQNDILFKMKNQKKYYKQKINKELSIRKNDIAVLLAIPGINRIHKSMLKTYRNSLVTIINILLKIDNKIKVIAKVHPKDDLKNFLFLNDISKNIILTKKYEIPYLLNISSMFLVNISSSIIDAMFLGVPVITYNLKNLELVDRELYDKEYHLEKAVIQVFGKRELKKKVNSLLFNKNYLNHIIKKQFTTLRKYAIIDGHCVTRNVSTILDILNQKKLKTSKY